MEATKDSLIERAVRNFLESRRLAGQLEQTLDNMRVTADGLENLRVVKEAEADFLRQDMS